MSKKLYVAPERPLRDPDHLSKRGVPYWWAPEWVRGTSADSNWSTGVCPAYGRIKVLKEHGTVNLYMESKEGNLTYIKGSIQQEFKSWHEDRKIDYMLLGEDPDTIDDLIIGD